MEHLGRWMVTAHAIWLQGFDNVNWSDSSWRPLLLVIPVFISVSCLPLLSNKKVKKWPTIQNHCLKISNWKPHQSATCERLEPAEVLIGLAWEHCLYVCNMFLPAVDAYVCNICVEWRCFHLSLMMRTCVLVLWFGARWLIPPHTHLYISNIFGHRRLGSQHQISHYIIIMVKIIHNKKYYHDIYRI